LSSSTFDTLDRRVVITGQVQLLSGLHIGTSETSGAAGTDLPVIKDFVGNPFIPGSSFKGVLRSNLESFLRSLTVEEPNSLHCNVIKDDTRCVNNEMKRQILERKNEYKGCDPDLTIWQKSCWVCRMFGSPWIASRIQVRDMPVDKMTFMPEWMMVRDGVVIDRETGTAASGGKYDFEVIPAQTRFNFEIMVENPSDAQLGLLALGFNFFNKGMALLGGKTARGLGRIQVMIHDIEEQTADSILSQLQALSASDSSRAEPNELETEVNEKPADGGKADEADENEHVSLINSILSDYKIMEHVELVASMQLRGWDKAQLKKKNFKNWKELFKCLCVEGHLVEVENEKYQLAGAPELDAEESGLGEIIEVQDEEGSDAAVRQQLQKWQVALWEELNLLLYRAKEVN
jgi:CRISPR-associated RAMP protein (TIGR02581 family)